MKQLLKITEQTFNPDAPKIDSFSFRVCNAARAVVINDKGEVYLLLVTSHMKHKLPGGGIDNEEEPEDAVLREVLEETGCSAKVIAELGLVTEWRDSESLIQNSYCYLAKQVGPLGKQALEQGEIDEGHELVIAKSIDEAIATLKKDNPTSRVSKFINLRELTLLRLAKELTV